MQPARLVADLPALGENENLNPMRRSFVALAGALFLTPLAAVAQDAQAQEIRELKLLLEMQMKRIDELTVQVGRLVQAIEAQKAAGLPGQAPKREVGTQPPFSGVTELKLQPAKPPGDGDATVSAQPRDTEAPKAEAVAGVRHTVAKGETLTSIAKQYNIPLADLQKVNKDVNDRKLQIGQTLIIPAAKVPETNPPKKSDNP
jgi:LysM repeat protein